MHPGACTSFSGITLFVLPTCPGGMVGSLPPCTSLPTRFTVGHALTSPLFVTFCPFLTKSVVLSGPAPRVNPTVKRVSERLPGSENGEC